MSSSNDEEIPEHPWLSLADILYERKISIADLTTVIERVGVKTYDRVGRLITANDGGEDERTSKARALYYLACYYAEVSAAEYLPRGQQPRHDPHRLLDEGSPLIEFGWVKPDVPNFAEVIADEVKQRGIKIESIVANMEPVVAALASQSEPVVPIAPAVAVVTDASAKAGRNKSQKTLSFENEIIRLMTFFWDKRAPGTEPTKGDLHTLVFNEMLRGKIKSHSKKLNVGMVRDAAKQWAMPVVLPPHVPPAQTEETGEKRHLFKGDK